MSENTFDNGTATRAKVRLIRAFLKVLGVFSVRETPLQRYYNGIAAAVHATELAT